MRQTERRDRRRRELGGVRSKSRTNRQRPPGNFSSSVSAFWRRSRSRHGWATAREIAKKFWRLKHGRFRRRTRARRCGEFMVGSRKEQTQKKNPPRGLIFFPHSLGKSQSRFSFRQKAFAFFSLKRDRNSRGENASHECAIMRPLNLPKTPGRGLLPSRPAPGH